MKRSPEAMVARIYETSTAPRPDWTGLAAELAAFFDARLALISESGGAARDEPTIEPLSGYSARRLTLEADLSDGLVRRLLRSLKRAEVDSPSFWVATARGVGSTDSIGAHLAALGIASAVAAIAPAGMDRVALVILARDSADPIGNEQFDLVRLVAEHLGRGVRLARQRTSLRLAALEVLDRLDAGAVAINRGGQVCGSNRSAELILGTNVSRPLGTFVLIDARGDEVALAELASAQAPAPPRLTSLTLFDPARGESVMAAFVSWPRSSEIFEEVAGVLLLVDTDQLTATASSTFAAERGLTKRETEVMLAFTHTGALKEAAGELGISWETARRHLKSIFEKTHTHSQLDLLQLLLTHSRFRERGD